MILMITFSGIMKAIFEKCVQMILDVTIFYAINILRTNDFSMVLLCHVATIAAQNHFFVEPTDENNKPPHPRQNGENNNSLPL